MSCFVDFTAWSLGELIEVGGFLILYPRPLLFFFVLRKFAYISLMFSMAFFVCSTAVIAEAVTQYFFHQFQPLSAEGSSYRRRKRGLDKHDLETKGTRLLAIYRHSSKGA